MTKAEQQHMLAAVVGALVVFYIASRFRGPSRTEVIPVDEPAASQWAEIAGQLVLTGGAGT